MSKKRKNYKIIPTIKNGNPFLTIMKIDPISKNIIYAMEKPDFKNMKDPNVLISGAHVNQFEPDKDHYDYWISGAPLRKEFVTSGSNVIFQYQISGSTLIIK